MVDNRPGRKYAGLLLNFEIPVDIDYADILRRSSALYDGVGEAVLIPSDNRPYVVLNCDELRDPRRCSQMLDEIRSAVDRIYNKYSSPSKTEAVAVARCEEAEEISSPACVDLAESQNVNP